MPFTNTVQQWFKAQMGGSLYLPDGWHGRPYDNQHILTSIDQTGSDLSITLDKKLILQFKNLQVVNATDRELVFGSFSTLRFEWENVVGGQRLTKNYEGGEVKIVSSPGHFEKPSNSAGITVTQY